MEFNLGDVAEAVAATIPDRAAIIQGDRIAAAACFLPLATNPALNSRFGTRHRAALGVTEESDALAIVLSEETGQFSTALRGDLEADLSLEQVRETLNRYASGRNPHPGPVLEPALKRAAS